MNAGLRHRVRTYLDQPLKRVILRGTLVRPLWKLRFRSFGAGSVVHKPIRVHGARAIAVGRDCVLLQPRLSARSSSPSEREPALRIGDRVMMRPLASIVACLSVTIEDDVSIASLSTVTDATHDVAAIADSGAGSAPAAVRIGRGTSIGQRVAVLAGSNVGRHCHIQSNSVVAGDIPDCSVATGAPARVVARTRGA